MTNDEDLANGISIVHYYKRSTKFEGYYPNRLAGKTNTELNNYNTIYGQKSVFHIRSYLMKIFRTCPLVLQFYFLKFTITYKYMKM